MTKIYECNFKPEEPHIHYSLEEAEVCKKSWEQWSKAQGKGDLNPHTYPSLSN